MEIQIEEQPLVIQESCNPDLEQCFEEQQLATATAGDFFVMIPLLLWQFAMPWIAVNLAKSIKSDISEELILLFGWSIFPALLYIPLMLLQLLFFISPLNLSSGLLVFLLSKLVLSTTFLITFGSTLVAIIYATTSAGQNLHAQYVVPFIAIQSYFLGEITYNCLPGAIRYVDPTWDGVAEGEALYPAFYYWIGLATRSENTQEEPEQIDQEELMVFTI